MTFSDIYTQVESLSNVKAQRTLIKHAIQMGLDRATARDLPYLMSEGRITTLAEYTTGTVTVTNGSKTVTGDGTTFTVFMVGRKFRIDADDDTYYIISGFTSITEITLETPYQGTTASGGVFTIWQDTYRLPADCDTYKVMRQIEDKVAMQGIEASAFDLYEPVPTSEGTPNYEIIAGSRLDTYSTGTLSGTISTSTLTFSGASLLSVEGLSRGSRITISTNVYTVKSVDSDTQITIYELLAVTYTTGTTYSISLDNLRIQFYLMPIAAKNIYFRYQRTAFPLIGDTDIPDLPDQWQWILIHAGLAWAWMTKDKEEALRQELIFEKAKVEMWERVAHPSSNRRVERASQDAIALSRALKGPRLPSGYGIPFSR